MNLSHIHSEKDKPIDGSIVTITGMLTPQYAARMLEWNTHNRAIRPGRTEKLVKDMAAGRFLLTHQGIAVAKDGRMIDGQHRLAACVRANVSIPITVTYNLPMDTQIAIDDHKPRTYDDAANLLGRFDFHISQTDIAVVRFLTGDITRSGGVSKSHICDGIELYKDAILWARGQFTTKQRCIGTAPILAAICKAYYSVDHTTLSRFIEILKTGITDGIHEGAAIALRNFLLANSGQMGVSGSNWQMAIHRKAMRAILAFVENKNIAKLVEVTGEPFSYPRMARVA